MLGSKRLDGQGPARAAEAVELACALGELSRSLVVYGIEGKNFAAGVGLSSEVEKAAGEVARQLLMKISPKVSTQDRD